MSKPDIQPTKRTRQRTPNNRTTTGFRISDELWAVLQPLLPVQVNTQRFGGGRPRGPDRTGADAIFSVLRTGCQWQALDQTERCAHSTAHDRFHAWVEAGVFRQLWQAGVQQFAELCGIDWDWLAMDGALTKAPLGGESPGRNPPDRGKSGVNRRLLTQGPGVPIGREVAGANRPAMKRVRAPLQSRVVARPAPPQEPPQGRRRDAGSDDAEG
jgi:putative transposase